MGFLKTFLFLMAAMSGSCNGSTYNVGDGVGWAILGNVNYNEWSSSKTFQVGDILVFEYDPLFHNVMRVTRSNFHTCNSESPIATYATGNDSIPIEKSGHFYYICGFVGHCAAGQKVDIRVGPGPSLDEQSPTPVASLGPSPSSSNGKPSLSNGLYCLFLSCVITSVFYFY